LVTAESGNWITSLTCPPIFGLDRQCAQRSTLAQLSGSRRAKIFTAVQCTDHATLPLPTSI
jgi:hypothetical protein